MVHLDGGSKRWKVAMTEPVLQGAAVKGLTRFLVLPPSGEEDEETGGASLETMYSSETEDDSLDFDFEIDESFLASTVLAPRQHNGSAYPTPLTSPLPQHPSSDSNALALNGLSHASFPLHASSSPHNKPSSGSAVTPVSLVHPVPRDLLVPSPDKDEDDVSRILVATADLGRLGLFSGDWVALRPSSEGDEQERRGVEEDEQRREGRLVRVFAADGLVSTSNRCATRISSSGL